MKTTSRTTLIACAVIAGAFTVGLASGPAMADPQKAIGFKFRFTYAPSELGSLPGAEKLLARLERDVRSYCSGNQKMSLAERKFVGECIDLTMKESVAKFANPTVAQAYQSRADG
jgi:UrcA family protein